MRTAKALLAIVVALTAVIGWSSAATATPGTTFDIAVSVGWIPPGECSNGDNTAPNCLGFASDGTTFTRLNWDNQTVGTTDSYLGIGALPGFNPFPANAGNVGSIPDGTATGVIISEGPIVQTAQIRHTNNVIDNEDNDLAEILLSTSLILSSGGTELLNLPLDVLVNFQETPNVETPAGSGLCATPNPLGSICDDVFTFDNLFADIPFLFNGELFILHIRGLVDAANNPTCTPTNGQVECFTEEDAVTDRFVIAFVTQAPVPAPAALLLVGLGLVGIAIRKRLSV